jgi:hypothetical protein
MKTLTTPITMANLTKWKVTKCVDNQDDDVPNAVVTIQVQGSGSVVYGVFSLTAFDSQNSSVLFVNAASQGYGDKILTGVSQLTGAYTAIAAANSSAGNRNTKLLAVEAACLSTGLVAASLAGS